MQEQWFVEANDLWKQMYMLRTNELIMAKINISTKANTLMIRKRNNNSIKKQNCDW